MPHGTDCGTGTICGGNYNPLNAPRGLALERDNDLSLFVSGIETTLMTIEATNAIAMQLEMIANGDAEPLRETGLMVREKDPDPTCWQTFPQL
jgi:hypothetical protein